MAIGRVPGAALLGNLDRQGLDLGFTTNSTTLLQLDFTNYRLGINTATPQQALDVTGNILVTTGNVYTSTDLTYDIGAVSTRWNNIYAGNVTSTNIAGTLTTAAQTNITSVGTLSSLVALLHPEALSPNSQGPALRPDYVWIVACLVQGDDRGTESAGEGAGQGGPR